MIRGSDGENLVEIGSASKGRGREVRVRVYDLDGRSYLNVQQFEAGADLGHGFTCGVRCARELAPLMAKGLAELNRRVGGTS